MTEYRPRDRELEDFCDSFLPGCEYCPMRTQFPRCGQGWHVYWTTGKENEAAHLLMKAAQLMQQEGTCTKT